MSPSPKESPNWKPKKFTLWIYTSCVKKKNKVLTVYENVHT